MKVTSQYITLIKNLLEDLGKQCSAKGCGKDINYIISRTKNEGLSFLMITLPNFGDDFFKSIERGYVLSTDFIGFKKSGYLPSLFSGFTTKVFDKSTGRMIDDEQISCIRAIRQVCYGLKKVKTPCTDERIERSTASYLTIEDELRRHIFPKSEFEIYEKICRIVVSTLFPGPFDTGNLLPHHGPGSTAEKLVFNRKYDVTNFQWYERLDSCFNVGNVIFPSEEHYNESDFTTCSEEPCVRVIHVPKTLKTPRVIALEPVVMQMTQQSIKDVIVPRIESCRLTRGCINFTDQDINRKLALRSSEHKNLATLDLSAASDRVHNELVRKLFAVNPGLCVAIQATRSPFASVGGKRLRLVKFASMGSALCFPVEALVFYCLILTAKLKAHPSLISAKTLQRLSRRFTVYGDDIIIPSKWAESVIKTFQSFGLKVSKEKSFIKSHFRESCGMDAYKGEQVTPVYFRAPFRDRRLGPSDIVSLVETSNQLYELQLTSTSDFLKSVVEGEVGVLPTKPKDTEGLGWVRGNVSGKTRFKRDLQRLEVQTLVPSISKQKDEIDGIPALTKCLLKLELASRNVQPSKFDNVLYLKAASDSNHLVFSPRRGALTLKRRWVAAS